MSYISISTNQPSQGQRELTERQPANLRNDFKVPIEIHNGDTIELVSLKFNIGSIIINDNNNKIVWSVGRKPFSTYHCALIPIGTYDTPEQLADGIVVAFNSSTLLPSYQKQSLANPYDFTNIPGWTCIWTPPTTGAAAKVGFFTIKANQSESPGDKTNGSIANAIFTTESTGPNASVARFIADGYAVNNTTRYASQLPIVAGIPAINRQQFISTTAGEAQIDGQVWSQKKWDSTSTFAEDLALNMFSLATDDTVASLEQFGVVGENIDGFDFFFHSGNNQNGNTAGHSFESSRIANSLTVESQLSFDVNGRASNLLGDMGGIYNNGGVIRCEVHPLIGFNIADFTTSAPALANFIGQTVTMQIRGYTFAGAPGPIERDFVVSAVNPTANNDWSIKLTTTTPFDATGNNNAAVDTVLWMAYVPDLVDADYGPLQTYSNGMFALGFTAGGGATAPPNASDRNNHNAFADPSNGRARNYWYYDADAQHFKCAFRQAVTGIGLTNEDEYTRPVRTPFCINGEIQPAPTMILIRAGSEVPMGIQPTQPLGYPACKVGLNRRARITEDFINHNPNEFAGFGSFSDSYIGNPIDEACEYSISINNGQPGPPGPTSVEVDATTGARVPIIKVVNPKSFQRMEGATNENLGEKLPPFGDRGWIQSNVAKEGRWTDTATWPGLSGFDPNKSIVLEIVVNKNNELTFSVGPTPSTTIVSANPYPIKPVVTSPGTYQLPITTSDNDTGVRLMESHYPLIPLIQVGGGSYYGISTAGVSGVNEEKVGAAYTIDMSGPYRLPDEGKTQIVPRLSFKDAYPDTAINQEFSVDSASGTDQILDETTTIASNASAARKQIVQRTTPAEKNREQLNFYNHGPAIPVNGPEANLFIENANCITDLRANSTAVTGMAGLGIDVIQPAVSTKTDFVSRTKINLAGVIESGVSVNILSGNIKGFNGGTSDINKAVSFLQPEQLEATSDGAVRTFFHESKTSRPVEFNVPNTQSHNSITVQLKNGNNELITGIEAPVEVILYKRSKDKEMEKIRAVLEGMKSDRQELKIQNAGINNPLLGVIPR